MQNYSSKFKILIYFVLLVAIFHFVLLTFHLSEANAQQTTLSISPPQIEIVVKPGKSLLVAYNLQNLTDPNIIKVLVLPIVAGDSRGGFKIKPEFEGPIRFSLDNSDIELEKPFFMRSKDSQQLLLRIRVPEGAPEGDYYYTFLAETQPPPISEGLTTSRAKATIGSNILITVTNSGQVEIKGRINFFDVVSKSKLKLFGRTYKFFDSSDKIPLLVIAENYGKNLIKPEGTIILKGNFGERAEYEILPENILATSRRVLKATPSAILNMDEPNSLVLSGFFIGNYKLSTSLSFGEGSSVVSASTRFTAIPFKFIVGLIIALLLGRHILRRLRTKEI